jgi:hypothetical protein
MGGHPGDIRHGAKTFHWTFIDLCPSVADEERIRQNTTEKYSYKWPDLAQELLNIIRHCLWLLHRGKVAALGMSLEPY